MIQKTSLSSYIELFPELGERQCQVYAILQVYPDSSNRELAEILGLPINSVTPRVKELRNHGLVVCSGYKYDSVTNRNVMTWKTV